MTFVEVAPCGTIAIIVLIAQEHTAFDAPVGQATLTSVTI